MDAPTLLLFLGLLYVLVFGALSLVRREGLSVQFALEGLLLTALAVGLSAFTPISTHPVLFIAILYLVTMRVRVLVDLGNSFARRNNFILAGKFYSLAESLKPDLTSSLILQINQGTALLQQGALDESIAVFKTVLERAGRGFLGEKHQAATHYNLGVAYRRKKMETQAALEFNAVVVTWPFSEYARYAQIALQKPRQKDKPLEQGRDTPGEN